MVLELRKSTKICRQRGTPRLELVVYAFGVRCGGGGVRVDGRGGPGGGGGGGNGADVGGTRGDPFV
jgi:hypothetical protein